MADLPWLSQPVSPQPSALASYGQPSGGDIGNFLLRLSAAGNGAAALQNYDAGRADYATQQEKLLTQQKLAALANDPALAKNPTMLLQKIAQATGDPNALIKWAEMGQSKIENIGGALVSYDPRDAGVAPKVLYQGKREDQPLSPLAKLTADYNGRRIDKDTYDRARAKEIAPAEKNYKQSALQSAAFADRMVNANGILTPFGDNGTDVVNTTSNFLASIPSFGLGKYLANVNLTDDQQKYRNAASEWIRAKLRKESGAAIGDKEMDEEYRTYFPVSGDRPDVIKQKTALRKIATEGMIKQSQGAYEDNYGNAVDGSAKSAARPLSELSTEQLLRRLKKK